MEECDFPSCITYIAPQTHLVRSPKSTSEMKTTQLRLTAGWPSVEQSLDSSIAPPAGRPLAVVWGPLDEFGPRCAFLT